MAKSHYYQLVEITPRLTENLVALMQARKIETLEQMEFDPNDNSCSTVINPRTLQTGLARGTPDSTAKYQPKYCQRRVLQRVADRLGVSIAILCGDTVPSLNKYYVVPASRNDMEYVAALEQQEYGEVAVPLQKLCEWYDVDTSGCFLLRNYNSCLAGQLTILRPQPKALKKLVDGTITETDLAACDIFNSQTRHLATALYVESLVVRPQGSRPAGPGGLRAVLAFIVAAPPSMANPTLVTDVYAMNATATGAQLLNKLRFQICKPGSARGDQMDFYVVQFKVLIATIRDVISSATNSGSPT
jgi:hypothetical protein